MAGVAHPGTVTIQRLPCQNDRRFYIYQIKQKGVMPYGQQPQYANKHLQNPHQNQNQNLIILLLLVCPTRTRARSPMQTRQTQTTRHRQRRIVRFVDGKSRQAWLHTAGTASAGCSARNARRRTGRPPRRPEADRPTAPERLTRPSSGRHISGCSPRRQSWRRAHDKR